MSPYKILGVTDQATDEEVKRAYLAMAAKYHPDAGGDAWVFAQVRDAYDRIIRVRQSATFSSNQRAPTPTAYAPHQSQQTASYSDYPPQPTSSVQNNPSFGKRFATLLFHHQLVAIIIINNRKISYCISISWTS